MSIRAANIDFWFLPDRSLKIWVCDRKIDWMTLSLVFIQAKVKFVSDS
jgi:hypothetical protein